MTTKKTTKKRASKKRASKTNGVSDEPVVINGDMYLSPLDLKTYDLAEHKYLVQNQARQLRERERDDAMLRFNNKISELKKAEGQALKKLMELRSGIKAKYGIDLNDPSVSYDDETGRILTLPVQTDRKETN